jgi:hypothetical protein
MRKKGTAISNRDLGRISVVDKGLQSRLEIAVPFFSGSMARR